MRVLVLSTWFPYPPDNGSKIRVFQLLRALGSAHQVSLLSFAFDTARPEEAEVLREFCVDVRAIECNPFERHGLVGAMRFLSPAPVVTRPLPEMAQTVRQVLDSTSFDIVIASTEVMATYALQAPRKTIKVLEEHNSLSRWMWERYQAQVGPVQRFRCWTSWRKTVQYEARLFRQFDLCVMVSEQDRAASVQMLPGYHGPIEVVPNGVDCTHNRPGLAQVAPHSLVFNGALTYSANYDGVKYFLTEVYPLVQRAVPDVLLTITGSTKGVKLDGLPLNDSVRLSGYLDDIRPMVAGSSVCVVPIQEGGGTRLKILEAMALGTPVVATHKAAEGIEATDGKHLLLADEAPAFAECIMRLWNDADLRQCLVTSARQLVQQRYDWTQIGGRFVKLIEDVTRCKQAGMQFT